MAEEMKYSLKELRARRNMTQRDVAKALGVSCQVYNKYENHLGSVKISTLKAIANVLDVPVSSILLD